MAHGLPPGSWKSVVGMLRRTKKGKQFLTLLANGCPSCEHDEAEGGLVDHCDHCTFTITLLAYEMFVKEDVTDSEAVAAARAKHLAGARG